jgi:hypothetical protein
MSEQQPDDRENGAEKKRVNPLQVIGSVLAAGLGVQSSKNRERDFKQGRAGVFIAAGIVLTVLFIAALVTVVQLVLENAR